MNDGSPSGALQRRVEAAIVAASHSPDPIFLVTGGRGRSGYVEADVMRRMLLAAGIPDEHVVCERKARNTLASVRNCAPQLAARRDVDRVFVCTDRYHQPRCRWLLQIAGIESEGIVIESAARSSSRLAFFYMLGRDIVATVVDCALMALNRDAHRR